MKIWRLVNDKRQPAPLSRQDLLNPSLNTAKSQKNTWGDQTYIIADHALGWTRMSWPCTNKAASKRETVYYTQKHAIAL